MNKISPPETSSAVPEAASGSPGAILRRCREFHGITLEEASESTKIGVSHLKALEEDRIHEFANQAYLKGFLRIYVTFLGLNSEDIARMYEKLFGSGEEIGSPNIKSKKPATLKKNLIPFKKLILPALLLSAILVTATLFKRPPSPLVRQAQTVTDIAPMPQIVPVQSAPSSARKPKKVIDVPPEKVTVPPKEPSRPDKPLQAFHVPDAPKSFILKIKVLHNGKLTLTVDEGQPQQYMLIAGDIIEWKAERRVAIDLSAGGSVEVELNGKPYKLAGSPGKPVYVELDADSTAP